MQRTAPFRILAVALVAMAALALSACGESKEEKALTAVCTAKADIQAQVDDLKMLTPGTFTTTKVQDGVQAIGDDLRTIQDNLPTLSDSARQQVKSANETFRSEFASVGVEIAKTISAEDAAAQLKQSFADLAAAYEQAFASVQCN